MNASPFTFAKTVKRSAEPPLVIHLFSPLSSHKMGLHGSSTVPLILQDVRVPAENVLGEIGKGHRVAFNVLNYGSSGPCAAAPPAS